jgi:hypothetical protein
MNLKMAVSILLLFAVADLSAAVEPLYVGRGVSDQVVNLDAGAARTGSHYSFTKSGFAAPGMPQSRIVSTSIFLHQAEKLRDEVRAIRDQTERLHNLTEGLAEHAKKSKEEIKTLTEEVRSEAQSSSAAQYQSEKSAVLSGKNADQSEKNAAQVEKYLGRVLRVYNDTFNQSQNIKLLSDETRINKEASDANLAKTKGYLSETHSLYNSTLNLSNEIRMSEAQTKRFWMDALNRSEKFALNASTI